MTHRPGTGSNPAGALPNFLPLFATFCALLRHHAAAGGQWLVNCPCSYASSAWARRLHARAAAAAASALGWIGRARKAFCALLVRGLRRRWTRRSPTRLRTPARRRASMRANPGPGWAGAAVFEEG